MEKIDKLEQKIDNLDIKFDKLLESQKNLITSQEEGAKTQENTLKLCELMLEQQLKQNTEINSKLERMLSHIDYLVKTTEDIKTEAVIINHRQRDHEDRIRELETIK